MDIYIPKNDEFAKGVQAFVSHEKRDAMYKVATFLVEHYWGKPRDMANGLGVLLLTWNQAFYRYGSFDFDKLQNFISNDIEILQTLRERDIFSFDESDQNVITELFGELYVALRMDII